MEAKSPEQVNAMLIEALTRGDIDAAIALYETDASFVTADGVVTGLAAIREVLTGFAAVSPDFTIDAKPTVVNGDIALTRSNWRLTGKGPGGEALEMSGSSCEVLRRGADGNWRFVIDNPDVG